MDYYDASDNKIGRADFNRVDREKWPHLDEKEKVENVFEFSIDQAKRLGIEKGIEQGIEKGIEQGIEKGIEQGIEKNRNEAVTRMLTRGMPEEQILDVLQLTVEQLNKIKHRLKN